MAGEMCGEGWLIGSPEKPEWMPRFPKIFVKGSYVGDVRGGGFMWKCTPFIIFVHCACPVTGWGEMGVDESCDIVTGVTW
nr:hypothetical protein [Salmonid herpesvirus 1]